MKTNRPLPKNDQDLGRLEDLFFAVVNMSENRRHGFLTDACQGDGRMRRLIERMVEADASGIGFIDNPTWSDWLAVDGHETAHDPLTQPGSRIDRYVVIRHLGEGGFGEVVLAEQAEPVRRHVALKVIKRGMDTKEVLQRFDSERRLLARCEHPGVARLIDAGITEDGRPYLVMEFVDGTPIDTWCDGQRLTVQDRLKLFLKVCDVAQYAHTHLLVHRDIKPSNILIDQSGSPKLIDFGLAKVLAPDESTQSHLTTVGGPRLLTPRYASPEQVLGQPASIATDIYSLGVLLYELLTGSLPYPGDISSRRSIEEAITQRHHIRPSDATCTTTGDSDACRPRSTTPAQLRRALRGEIDTILLKALAKTPNDRYPTVSEFADDVRRHLENRPIKAVPETLAVATRKFVQRNRVVVAFGVMLTLTLSIATAVSVSSYVRESRAREIADAINTFLNEDLLLAADPSNTENPDVTVREALERAASKIDERFEKKPEVEAAIRYTIGSAYLGLGLPREAIPHLQRSTELRQGILGKYHEDARDAMREWVTALQWENRHEEARVLVEELLELDIAAAGRNSADTMATMHLHVQIGEYEPDEARAACREIMDWNAANLGESNPSTLAVMHSLANMYIYDHQPYEAEPIINRIVGATSAHYGPHHPETLMAMTGQAMLYGRIDRMEEAVNLFEEVIRIHHETQPENNMDLGITYGHLGAQLNTLERYDEAEQAFLDGIHVLRQTLSPENGWLQGIIRMLVDLYDRQGETQLADEWRANLVNM